MIDFWLELYKKLDIKITDFRPEKESNDYFACDVLFEGKNAKFRVAKITLKKIGQFVTLWKRENDGPILPFDFSDDIDFVIISVQNQENIGRFIFPKNVLCEKGIFTSKKEGKRAFRVYPPWDLVKSPQAVKTQKWQLDFYYNLK